MRVVLTGATGFVGVKLIEKLHSLGDRAIILARDPQKAKHLFPTEIFPNVEIVGYTPQVAGAWTEVFSRCDGVVNLAGTPIFGDRWNAKRKQEILESRQLGTREIVNAIKAASPQPQVLVSGSAIGFYGTDEVKTFDEYSFAGNDFLSQVCQAWEQEADAASAARLRVVKLRTGIVLGKNGGALARILPIFQLGLGGVIGSGRQWFSWIHRDDLVNMIQFALTNSQITGVVNGTAPTPVTNAEFTKALAKACDRPAFLPVPSVALQLALGEAAILVLEGQKVLPKKAEQNQFQFQYPDIDSALAEVLA